MGQTVCGSCSRADPATDPNKLDYLEAAGDSTYTSSGACGDLTRTELADDGNRRTQKHECIHLAFECDENCKLEFETFEPRLKNGPNHLEGGWAEQEADLVRLVEADFAATAQDLDEQVAAVQARTTKIERAAREQARIEVEEFIRSRGFKGIEIPRSKFCRMNYPLHVAARENDIVVVNALLKCEANRTVQNSAGKTPLEVAIRARKGNSHDAVIDALS